MVSGAASGAVETRVLLDEGDRIILEYDFGEHLSRDVDIMGAGYQEIRIPSEPVFLTKGSPALPHINRSIIIPGDARMKVSVLSSEFSDSYALIAPSKGNLSRKIDPDRVPYEFGGAYRTNAFFPGDLAMLHDPYILRDHRGIVVQVNPFQYNPVTRVLREYSSMTIEVAAAGPGQINVMPTGGRDRASSPAFDEIYGAHFLNHAAGGRDFVEEGKMLVICHDAWIPNMAAFETHKESAAGIDTTIVGVSTIGNDSASIKSYIQQMYDTDDLAFVLLVGDIAQIDAPQVNGGTEYGASDSYYSKLAGADDYPDILVGRFSAATAANVDTMVQRTIDFELAPGTSEDWFWRGTGIASAEGAGIGDEGQSDIQHQTEIRNWLIGAGYTQVDQLYDPGASDSQVANALNAGRGVVNYTGHGYSGGWGTTGFNSADVNALTNSGMLPLVFSVACNNGEFENYSSCFGETWLRATHNGQPSGAVGCYASSVSQHWAPPMEAQDEFNLLLTDPAGPYQTFGGLCYAGSISMMDDYGTSGLQMFDTWILFGDPSLRVRGVIEPATGLKVEPSVGMSAEGPAGGIMAPDTMQYTLTNQDEEPLEWSASPVVPWLTVDRATGTLPALGSDVVTVTINENASNLDNGQYTGLVEFTNLSRQVGDTERNIALTVGVPARSHEWNMDNDPGWSVEGQWGFGVPLGEGGGMFGYPDPTSGYTGDQVYGVNINGDFPPLPSGPHYLTTTPFDLSGAVAASLRFQRWLNTKGVETMSATIEVSNDGSTWEPVWSATDDIAEDAWSLQEYDITGIAADQSSVYLRWGYGVSMMSERCSGWNIDDVEIWSVPQSIRINLIMDAAEVSWNPVPGAIGYDVVRGDLGTLWSTGGDFSSATDTCVADNNGDTTLDYTEEPAAPGEGHWILIRAVTDDGPLTWQTLAGVQVGTRDAEIEASGNTCP
jgi:hypothetical protein